MKIKECHTLNIKCVKQVSYSTCLTNHQINLIIKEKNILNKHFLFNPNFIRVPP